MGTDIHGFVERRDTETGAWNMLTDFELPINRNYSAFSILADVRNGYGFAGLKTGAGYKPIAEPRGWPEDVSVGLDSHYLTDDFYHSHQWLTLREILTYDYTQTTRSCGVISWPAYRAFVDKMKRYSPTYDREHPRPESYSSWIWGHGIIIIDQKEAEAYGDQEDQPQIALDDGIAEEVYVRVQWTTRYVEVMGDILLDLLPLVKYGLDDVRLVFCFDN